jgi:hypothetical protein
MPKHDDLLEAAKTAADKLYADTSVSSHTTAMSLGDLKDHVELLLESSELDEKEDDDGRRTP